MSDEVDLSTDTLRRMYGQALTQASRAVEPEHMVAWAALAALTAELRAALGEAGVIAQVEAPVEAVSPWRSVATDPPTLNVVVFAVWATKQTEAAFHDEESGQWCDTTSSPCLEPPLWWMPIPPLPEVAS